MNDSLAPRQRTGLALTILISLVSIPSVFFGTPDGSDQPPIVIMVLASVLGVVGLAAAVYALRSGSKVAIRIAAATLVINILTSLPTFFVDIPAALRIFSGVGVILSLAALVLVFSSARSSQFDLSPDRV